MNIRTIEDYNSIPRGTLIRDVTLTSDTKGSIYLEGEASQECGTVLLKVPVSICIDDLYWEDTIAQLLKWAAINHPDFFKVKLA